MQRNTGWVSSFFGTFLNLKFSEAGELLRKGILNKKSGPTDFSVAMNSPTTHPPAHGLAYLEPRAVPSLPLVCFSEWTAFQK